MNRKRKSESQGRRSQVENKPAWDALTQDHRQYQLSQQQLDLRKSQRISKNHIRVWQQLQDEEPMLKQREEKVKSSVIAYIAKHHQEQPLKSDFSQSHHITMQNLQQEENQEQTPQQTIANQGNNTRYENGENMMEQEDYFDCDQNIPETNPPQTQVNQHQQQSEVQFSVNENQQSRQSLQATENQQQQNQSAKVDFLVENLQQMSQFLGDIRNHQVGIEQEFRTFMGNVQSEISKLNQKMQEIQNFCSTNQSNLQNQMEKIQQTKKQETEQSFENFQQQQQQLSEQLEKLRFDLNQKDGSVDGLSQKENIRVGQQIRNWGPTYPEGVNSALGGVVFEETPKIQQRVPLMTNHIPLGKAFADNCCIDPQNRYH